MIRYRWMVGCLLISRTIALEPSGLRGQTPSLMVWNVGQGLWQTWVTSDTCWHFDMGGEYAPWPMLKKICAAKSNRVEFSHHDWDHINLTRKTSLVFKDLCAISPQHHDLLRNLPICQPVPTSWHRELRASLPIASSSKNDLSRAFVLANWALLTGDSTRKTESAWSSLAFSKVKILILGHHGSRTSTSELLLSRLPNLQMAIASSRSARYGHPHPSVTARLKKRGIALLKTEDWGTLIIQGSVRPTQVHPPQLRWMPPTSRPSSLGRS